MDIVVASSEGDTALRLMQMSKEAGFAGKVVCVSCAYGSKEPGKNRLSDERRRQLTEGGVQVVTAAHALSGGERGLTKVFGSVHPPPRPQSRHGPTLMPVAYTLLYVSSRIRSLCCIQHSYTT